MPHTSSELLIMIVLLNQVGLFGSPSVSTYPCGGAWNLKRHAIEEHRDWTKHGQPQDSMIAGSSRHCGVVLRGLVAIDSLAENPVTLINALDPTQCGTSNEAVLLRTALGVQPGLLVLLLSIVMPKCGGKAKTIEHKQLEQWAWVRLAELAVFDSINEVPPLSVSVPRQIGA
ncbi:hypothetical protein BGW80DRAFT_1256690 [Lactifluus volemus]|nr:hypothetical protein BGW80DRAFT_1256690 [Lactifluus volemus]